LAIGGLPQGVLVDVRGLLLVGTERRRLARDDRARGLDALDVELLELLDVGENGDELPHVALLVFGGDAKPRERGDLPDGAYVNRHGSAPRRRPGSSSSPRAGIAP